jgi:hypothetical protein
MAEVSRETCVLRYPQSTQSHGSGPPRSEPRDSTEAVCRRPDLIRYRSHGCGGPGEAICRRRGPGSTQSGYRLVRVVAATTASIGPSWSFPCVLADICSNCDRGPGLILG